MIMLPSDNILLAESPCPESVFTATPDIVVLPSGRYIASYEFFQSSTSKERKPELVEPPLRLLFSDDRGASWREAARLDITWPSLFFADGRLYLIGNRPFDRAIVILAATDSGEKWSRPVVLFHGHYHGAATSVTQRNGVVYRAFERVIPGKGNSAWQSTVVAGTLARDLLDPASWRMAPALDYPGTPELLVNRENRRRIAEAQRPEVLKQRPQCKVAEDGWLEGNIVDVRGRLLVLSRVRVGNQSGAGMTAVCELVDHGDAMEYCFVQFHPMPGGQCKFRLLYDDVSDLFWTAANLCTDSWQDPEPLWRRGFRGGPANERRILALMYSLDALNWFQAGCIRLSRDPLESYSYASQAIDGDDLLIVARTSEAGLNQHDTNRITLHRIGGFRQTALTLSAHAPTLNPSETPC